MKQYYFDYNQEKNQLLIEQRNIGFEDIIAVLDSKGPVAIIDHPNQTKYSRQKLFLVDVDDYIYVVPYVEEGDKIFLKTIFPHRKLTKLYLKAKQEEPNAQSEESF